MADKFQAGVCGGNWWNPSGNMFGLSFCSSVINTDGVGGPADLMEMKARCSDELSGSASEGSIIFQDIQKPINKENVWMDSSSEMMGSDLPSSITTDWNQTLPKRNERNYESILQEDMNSSLTHQQDDAMDFSQIKKDWSPKNFPIIDEDSSINEFKPVNQSFPVRSSSYGYPSSVLQTLFDTNFEPPGSVMDNRSTSYSSTSSDCRTKVNENSSSLPGFCSLVNPSLPKQLPIIHFNLSNKTPFWNGSAAAMSDVRASFFSPPTFEDKPNRFNLTTKPNNERVRDFSSVVKRSSSSSSEPAFKRPRIETPSPLPTFKVRKEKLGDRITALQQLVSPFGKTDTASVLHEAIEYIKILHDQVSVLSTPYMKNGAPIQSEPQTLERSGGTEEVISQDLSSRGLCLVPISSTLPVTAETTADFWTPTFEGIFR